jgi:hypothetical protein
VRVWFTNDGCETYLLGILQWKLLKREDSKCSVGRKQQLMALTCHIGYPTWGIAVGKFSFFCFGRGQIASGQGQVAGFCERGNEL